MTESTVLVIDIQNYWHVGTGRGSGSHLDALVDTTHDGLPYLAGRHLKGLLRDAVYKAEKWNRLGAFKHEQTDCTLTDLLFGKRNTDNPETRVPHDKTTTGMLRIGDALLPPELRAWLAHAEQSNLRSHLYRELSSTAMDHDTGIAKNRSLRSIQVIVPLRLEAGIEIMPRLHRDEAAPPKCDWRVILRHCLPLIRAVGAHRSRGLGRARLSLQEGSMQ